MESRQSRIFLFLAAIGMVVLLGTVGYLVYEISNFYNRPSPLALKFYGSAILPA